MDQTILSTYLIWQIFLVILVVLWFCLPFAIFGTKPRLDELIAQVKRTNEELEKTNEELEKIRIEISVPPKLQNID